MVKLTFFHSPSCGPCGRAKEVLRKVKARRKDLKVSMVNVDTAKGSTRADKEGVRVTPTMVVVKRGKKRRLIGVTTAERLEKLI